MSGLRIIGNSNFFLNINKLVPMINLETVTYNGEGGFVFIEDENGNFIYNNAITIPCGNLVTSAIDDEIFFSLMFEPDGKPLIIPYRLFDITFYDKIVSGISDAAEARIFISRFKNSFKNNHWYNNGWLWRLISKLDMDVHSKALLMYSEEILNTTQVIYLFENNVVRYSADIFLNSVPYELVETSKKIMTVSEIKSILVKHIPDFESLKSYFLISNSMLKELNRYDLSDVLKISYFYTNFYDKEVRDRKYETFREIDNISNSVLSDVLSAIFYKFRETENKIRVERGFNLVGSLFNETLLYNRIKQEFPELKIVSQYSPEWIAPQRFDIFIMGLDIAIEYNGIQHYKVVDYFGGGEGLKRTQRRDERKRRKCRKNKCTLIEIKYDEDIDKSISQIIKVVKEKLLN